MQHSNTETSRFIVTILGLSLSLILAAIIGCFNHFTGFSLNSYIYSVIPIGSIITGFLINGLFFYVSVIRMRQKPIGTIFLNILLSTIGSLFLIYYIPYYLSVFPTGERLRDFFSFIHYVDYIARNSTLSGLSYSADDIIKTVNLTTTESYVFTGLETIGFLIGGLIVYKWLSKQPYCEKCNRFLKKAYDQMRYTGDADLFKTSLKRFFDYIEQGDINRAVQFHSKKMGIEIEAETHVFKASLITSRCENCGSNHMQFTAFAYNGNVWKTIPNTKISRFI